MLVQGVAVLDWINGNHLVPPAVNVLQPEQQTVAHLMEVLWKHVHLPQGAKPVKVFQGINFMGI